LVSLDDAGRTTERTEKTERGRYTTKQLDPPSRGLIAVQGVARPPMEHLQPNLLERASEWLSGKDSTSLPQAHMRARRTVLLTPSSQSQEAVSNAACFKSLLDAYGVPVISFDIARAAELSAYLQDDVLVVAPRQAAVGLSDEEVEALATWIER